MTAMRCMRPRPAAGARWRSSVRETWSPTDRTARRSGWPRSRRCPPARRSRPPTVTWGSPPTPELRVAIDARAMASAQQGSGVGSSVAMLVRGLEQLGGVHVILSHTSGMPVVGPHLLMPLRARLRRAQVFHGPAHSLPLTRLGLPAVVTINDLAIYEHPEWFPDRQWVSTRVLVPRSVRGARIVVCPSEATRRSLLGRFRIPPDRCRVIPLGVDPVFAVSAPPSEGAGLRESLRLPEQFVLQV